MGQMVGITHVSIHKAKFDLCLNFMYISPGNVGFVHHMRLCSVACSVFLSEVFLTFPSFAI